MDFDVSLPHDLAPPHLEWAAIVATDLQGGIGRQGSLPWSLPNDLKFFRNMTRGHICIMGRKTFESIGKPLPHRHSLILSHSKIEKEETSHLKHGELVESVNWCASQEEIFQKIRDLYIKNPSLPKRIYVIGGGLVYKIYMNCYTHIFRTLVNAKIDDCDAWFPKIRGNDFSLISSESHHSDVAHNYEYAFELWVRSNG